MKQPRNDARGLRRTVPLVLIALLSACSSQHPTPARVAVAPLVLVGGEALCIPIAVVLLPIIPLTGDWSDWSQIALCGVYSADNILSCGLWGGEPLRVYCSEYGEFENAGLADNEIGPWVNSGFTPADAFQWSQSQFSAPEAHDWKAAGFQLTQAVRWRNAGFTLQEADAYAHHYGVPSPTLGDSLRRAGITLSDITDPLFPRNAILSDWLASGFTPQEVQAYSDLHISLGEAVQWERLGSFGTAKPWITAGAAPTEAVEWVAQGLPADSYYLKSHNLTPETVRHWQDEGINVTDPKQTEQIEEYLRHGSSLKNAIYYLQNNVPVANVHAFEHHKTLLAHFCRHGNVENVYNLFVSSPYSTNGKCYEVWGVVYQWLGPTRALVQLFGGGRLALVAFDKAPLTVTFQGLAIGRGAYTYVDTLGAPTTVPELELVH
jgi:hypothetical protein